MSNPPPRAFTQGLGQVFQVSGVVLFVVMMFICCSSSLLSKDYATRTDLTTIGWGFYSAQKAITVSLFAGVFFGLALAGIGLGLQSEHRAAPILAVILTLFAAILWTIHSALAATLHSVLFTTIAAVLACFFAVLFVFSVVAFRETRRNPPPAGHELLPKDYKIPYSHYHDDPPEVRLARELDERRQRLAVQQKELEMLEEKLKRKQADGS